MTTMTEAFDMPPSAASLFIASATIFSHMIVSTPNSIINRRVTYLFDITRYTAIFTAARQYERVFQLESI